MSKFKVCFCMALLVLIGATPALAQEAAPAAQQPAGTAHLVGMAKTASGVPVPGATVRITHLESGQAWVSWTDDFGKFELSNLPAGRYRVEAQQLGFQLATVETQIVADAEPEKVNKDKKDQKELELTMRVATLTALAPAAPPAAPSASEKPASAAETKTETAKSETPAQPTGTQPSTAAPAPGGAPGTAPATRPGQPNRQQMTPQQMMEAMRGRGGFQSVDPTQMAAGGADSAGAVDGSPLGDAASSDSVMMGGTVARGATAGGQFSFPGFFPGGMASGSNPFGGGAIPGADGGAGMAFGPGGAMPAGAMEMIVMGAAMMGGGPGGGQQGQQRGGQPGQQGRQGQGQRGNQQNQQRAQGQGGPAPAGATPLPGGFGDAMGAMMGMQRLIRQQVNRVRWGFFTRYGNSIWDARPYSLTEADPAKIGHWRANYGFNIGGPMVLGKLYNGRDKTFFFANYSGGRRRSPVDSFATVPTLAERGGDFTASGAQLFDPNSSLTGPRTPLGSIVPPNLQDPAAVALLQFIPLPNVPGATFQNFHLQTRVPAENDSFNIRILHTINAKLNLQANYNANWSRSESIPNFPTLLGTSSGLGQNFMIGLTQQLSPRISHDSRFNWSRQRSRNLNLFAFVNDIAGNLGITGISTDPVNWGVPQINYSNFTDLNDPVPSLRRNQTFRYTDSISWTRAKHTWRAGAEIRRMHNNNQQDPTARGSYSFTGLMSADLDANGLRVPGTGLDFADFLMGLPQSTNVRFGSSSTYFRNWGFVAYMQDDWRLHPRFTVNWGLRYEAITPPVELFDHLANIDVNSDFTAAQVIVPGQTAPFSGDVGRSLVRGDYNNWAPRFGFAWRPKLKKPMTVRGGYSLFHNTAIYTQLVASMANQPPHAQAQVRFTSANSLLTLIDGFPPAPLNSVLNTIAIDPNYKVGYAQIWNFSVESQLIPQITVEATYTGTKGTHLDLLRLPNRLPGTTPFDDESNRRIPGVGAFTYDTFGASSIYHALQMRVQRRFSRGFMLMGTYTYGKSIDNASSIGGGAQVVVLDDNNFALERGLSSFDVRHQFRAFYNYELPFGERRRWAKRGTAASILGNWSVSGSATVQSGTPFTARLLGGQDNSCTGTNFAERADQIGDPNLFSYQRTPQQWFNTAAFAVPAPCTFGNAARNTIAGPGTVLFSFSTGKNIRLGKDGQRRLDLRWEVQNLLNTPNFSGLNTIVGSSTYGSVTGARQMRTMDLSLRFNF